VYFLRFFSGIVDIFSLQGMSTKLGQSQVSLPRAVRERPAALAKQDPGTRRKRCLSTGGTPPPSAPATGVSEPLQPPSSRAFGLLRVLSAYEASGEGDIHQLDQDPNGCLGG